MTREEVLNAGATPRRGIGRRLLPLVVLAAAIVLAVAFDLHDYLSFAALRDNREVLMHFVHEYAVLSVVAYILVYAVATALSLPGGFVLTVAGGFLYGAVVGTLWVVIGATAGAVVVFLAARTALGDVLRRRAGIWMGRMEAGFRDNALSYLLVLRLVPLFPFFVVNLVPAFLGVPLRTYALATVIGIVPGAFVFASVGAGLGSVFDEMKTFSPAAALTPEVITALVGLAALSLLPVAWRKVHAARAVTRRRR